MKTPIYEDKMVRITVTLSPEAVAWFDRQPKKNKALRDLIEKHLGVDPQKYNGN